MKKHSLTCVGQIFFQHVAGREVFFSGASYKIIKNFDTANERGERSAMAVVVAVKRLRKEAILPKKWTARAAGYDLYACTGHEKTAVGPHVTQMISSGIAVQIPEGYFGCVFARSGLAAKMGLRPANCVGVIDADYRGEIVIALHNDSDKERVIRDGERIAQLVIMPCPEIVLKEVDCLDSTERQEGGFGHTGLY